MRAVPIAVIAVLACAALPALAQAPDSNPPPPAQAPEAASPAAAVPARPCRHPLPNLRRRRSRPKPLRRRQPAASASIPSMVVSCASMCRPGRSRFAAPHAGWTCETAAEDRTALETEIGRLQDEVAGLKQDLAALREPPPPRPPADLSPPPPPPPDKRDDAAQLREGLERARVAFENAWRRLVDMLVNFQKDVMRNGLSPSAGPQMRRHLPNRLSEITRATPQLIASATLRVETRGTGFSDIAADAARFIAQIDAGEGACCSSISATPPLP